MAGKTRACEICMKPIESERIESARGTRLCLEHARRIAKYGGEFKLTATLERTSKEGSLKKDYGGVNTRLTRNQEALDKLRDEYYEEQHPPKE